MRGDIVRVANRSGDFSGKPRPALIVQSDLFNETHESVCVCPITTDLTSQRLFRLPVAADDLTGLREESEVAIDKVQSIWVRRVRGRIGSASDELMIQVDQALRRWLAL